MDGSANAQTVTVLSRKLGDLSTSLQEWSGATIGNVAKTIKKLEKELAVLQNDPRRLAPSHAEIKTSDRLVELYHMEEIMQRQRSRVDWLTDGDSYILS